MKNNTIEKLFAFTYWIQFADYLYEDEQVTVVAEERKEADMLLKEWGKTQISKRKELLKGSSLLYKKPITKGVISQ